MAPEVDNWKTGCALGAIPFDWSFLLLSPRVVNLAFFDLLVLTFVLMTGGVEIVGSSKDVCSPRAAIGEVSACNIHPFGLD